jgi:pimeloyl-ACP methyl ester carboxylesterase
MNKYTWPVAAGRQPARTAWAAAGALLAGAALFVQYKARQAERRNPPLGQFIEVDGVKLHYVERGEGPPLVLIHGNGSMVQDFETSGLLDLAATRYRVIAFDRPGYGYSERPRGRRWDPESQADLLFRALQQLEIDRPIVAGHSWGALVATALALQHPVYVKSVVLMSGYYYPTFRLDALLMSPPALPVVGDLMRHTISPLIGRLLWPRFVRRVFAPAAVPPKFSGFPMWMALRPSQLRASAAEGALLIPATLAMKPRYRELIMPVMIVAGDSDRYIDTAEQSERLHRELPQSDLRLVRGAGHMVHQIAPRQVMAALESVAAAA